MWYLYLFMSNLKKKNLLVICDGYPSKDNTIYSNIFVKTQLKYIAPKFKKVIVISPTPYFPKILKNSNLFPKRFLNSAKLENYQYNNIEVYFPKFFTLPFSSYYQKNKCKLFYDSCLRTIKKYQLEFDLIHAHFTKPAGVVANKLKEKFDASYILTVHEDTKWLDKEILSKDTDILNAWKFANLIVRVNKKDINKLKKYNANTQFIPNGYDNNKYFLVKNNIHSKSKEIICIGNLVINQKNQINLIKAIKLIIKEHPEIQLSIIGQGADKKLIEKEINLQNLNKHIALLGTKTPDEINKLLNKSDLLVLPSFSESFGIVQIEAMACGVPVVATINGGSEEIITSKDVGLLVKDPNNIEELAQAIEVAIIKKWNKRKIVKFAKKYSLATVVKKIIVEYNKIIK